MKKLFLTGLLATFIAMNAQAQTSGDPGNTPVDSAGQIPSNSAGQTPVNPAGETPMNPAGQTPTTDAAGRLGVGPSSVQIGQPVVGLGTTPIVTLSTNRFGIASNVVPPMNNNLFTRTNRAVLFPTGRTNGLNPIFDNSPSPADGVREPLPEAP